MMMPDVTIMRNDPVVIHSEGIPLEKPSTTPPPPVFTPINHFQVMSPEWAVHSSTLPAYRRSRTMKPLKDMEMESIQAGRAHIQALTATIRLPPLTPSGRISDGPLSNHNHGASRLYRVGAQYNRWPRGSTRPSSNYSGNSSSSRIHPGTPTLPKLRLAPMTPYHNPLPNIMQQKLLEEDEAALLEATLDSPPPPTYQDTVHLSKWVEQTAHQTKEEIPRPSVTSEANEETQKEEEELNKPILKDAPKEGLARNDVEEDKRPETAKSARLNPKEQEEDDKTTGEGSENENGEEVVDYAGIVARMSDKDMDTRLQATIDVRKRLSVVTNPDIQSFLDAGVLKPAIECLQNDNVSLQHEAAWAITNIASGTSEDTKAVVDSGAVEVIVDRLRSPSVDVQEQCIWCLGNIVGDSPTFRDVVINMGVLQTLTDLLQEDHSIGFLRNFSWMLSNVTRHKPLELQSDDLDLVLKSIKILLENNDGDIKRDCLWTLSYITENQTQGSQKVIEANLLPKVVEFMDSNNNSEALPALRIAGNIAAGSDAETECILDAGVLPHVKKILETQFQNLKKEAAWFLSNVTAGTKDQGQRVIDAGLLPLLVQAATTEVFKVRKEAIWALSNLTVLKQESQIRSLIMAKGLQALLAALDSNVDGNIVQASLEGLGNILKTYQDTEDLDWVRTIILDNRGVDVLETLLGSANEVVVSSADTILNEYFKDSESSLQESSYDFRTVDFIALEEDVGDNWSAKVSNQAFKYMPNGTKDTEDEQNKINSNNKEN